MQRDAAAWGIIYVLGGVRHAVHAIGGLGIRGGCHGAALDTAQRELWRGSAQRGPSGELESHRSDVGEVRAGGTFGGAGCRGGLLARLGVSSVSLGTLGGRVTRG